jgi:hypothetical protein
VLKWTLASLIRALHSSRFLTINLQFLIPKLLSHSTLSNHHLLVRPLLPPPSVFAFKIILGILLLFILSSCPSHVILKDFTKLILSSCPINSSVSLFVLILQFPSTHICPYILRIIFLSKTRSQCTSVTFTVHVSAPYVIIGRTRFVHNLIFVLLDKINYLISYV